MFSIFGNDPKHALFIILNLILIESLLSVDNAAALATMVSDLPQKQKKRALRIGIVFAYIFRGLALAFAFVLYKILWLKLLGGLYLVYLALEFFYKNYLKKEFETEEDVKHHKKKQTFLDLNQFWTTVLFVELMDLTFSIDNIFAAVAFTNNIYLICIGVFIGILAMRFVAGWFVALMERFPFLEVEAFIIILLLGLKLVIPFACNLLGDSPFCRFMADEHSDLYFSILTIAIFILPVLSSLAFNFPKRKTVSK